MAAAAVDKFTFTDFRKHLTVDVYGGDVAQEDCDALVIACSIDLKHSGLAAALVQMAGDEVLTQCKAQSMNGKIEVQHALHTVAGHLPAKNLVHVAPPSLISCGGDDTVAKVALEEMFQNAIIQCKHINARTITFTAVARGLGFKPDVWSVACTEALLTCMNDARGLGCIQNIRFVDSNDNVVRTILNTFKKQLNLPMKKMPAPSWAMLVEEEKKKEVASDESSEESDEEEDMQFDDDQFMLSSDEAPSTSGNGAGASKEQSTTCSICLDEYTNEKPIYFLPQCKHDFHKACIDECFMKRQPQCPVCKVWYGIPNGNMPDGATMTVQRKKGGVDGFDCTHFHQIAYSVPGGTQTANHPLPGVAFTGTSRIAYIPDTEQGRQMLALLKIAFDHKLTFTVGDSVTSGQKNVVTWNNIHHKTSLNGGAHCFGYPDPEYLNRLEDELKTMGITKDMIKK